MNKFNKVLFFVALSGFGLSNAAIAGNTGTIRFIGSVTSQTCNIIGEQDNIYSNTITLGDYTKDEVLGGGTTEKLFNLRAFNDNQQECTPQGSIEISWTPINGWDQGGLMNTGTAKDVVVKLMDKDSVEFGPLRNNVTYDQSFAATYPFKAQLISSGTGVTAGSVRAAASFIVVYQ